MSGSRARWAIAVGAVVLAVAHQDWWLWEDRTLVFGFVPSGLFYHGCYALVAAGFWWLAMRVAWPGTVMDGLDAEAASGAQEQASGSDAASTGGPQ